MDLKETIKQQGTQASVLLPEIQEYVDSKVEELRGGGVVKLSAKGFSGSVDSAEIIELKGYQNILAIWDKLEKGEIQEAEINATLNLVIDGGTYKAHKIIANVNPSGERNFDAYFLGMDFRKKKIKIGELYISNYSYPVATINSTTIKFTTIDGQTYNISGAFTD